MSGVSQRFLVAFNVALSISVAYFIALSMAWDNPHWAAFSIAFCSLATVGESLLKGMLRTFGTFVAIFIALFLLALFPQDRWVFASCVSLWVAFCAWKMHANPRWYFWFCAGLGVPLMSMLSGGESLQAFQTVVLRAQETILGTLVFTVVSSLVFPTNTRGSFEEDVRQQLVGIQETAGTARTVLLSVNDESTATSVSPGILKSLALRQTGLMSKLQAAALDSFDVAETKHQWANTVTALGGAVDILEKLRLSLPDLEGTKPIEHLSGLEATMEEIVRRISAARKTLDGEQTEVSVTPLQTELDTKVVESLPAFQRAALAQVLAKLKELDEHSKTVLLSLADIRGLLKSTGKAKTQARKTIWFPDPERVYSTLRVFAAFWLTFIAYVFIPDLPSPVVLIAMTTAISMLMVMAPTLPLRGLAVPVVISILFGGAVHMLIMPLLSGYGGLGATVFAGTFAICWICHTPQQAMGRALGLAFFAVLTQVENTQAYSFTFVANLTVAFGLVLSILVVVSHVPVSFKPERVIERLTRRYFNSVVALLETVHVEKRARKTWLERQIRAYHSSQLKAIPRRLVPWVKALSDDVVSSDERKTLNELVGGLAMLSDRTQDLLSTRDVEHSKFWVSAVVKEAREWRHAIQYVCAKLGALDTGDLSIAELNHRLSQRMDALEDLVAKALREKRTDSASYMQNDALFRELGGFRGVSTTLLSLVQQSQKIDWQRFQEARL